MSNLTTESLASELRAALSNNKLQLFYQPKVDAFTEITVGGEAFIHWDHVTEGVIPPSKWLPVAEEHNLLYDLTFWALKKVAEKLEKYPESQLVLSVNVPPSLLDETFLRDLKKLLQTTGANPTLLELEITEQEAIVDLKQAAKIVDKIRKLGVKVSLDDFGAGFSTMQYLVHLCVDEVKIDKSFVENALNMKSAQLVLGSLIGLAKEIGVTVICEGVEDREQLALVTEFGADKAQGYLFGGPAPMLDEWWLRSDDGLSELHMRPISTMGQA